MRREGPATLPRTRASLRPRTRPPFRAALRHPTSAGDRGRLVSASQTQLSASAVAPRVRAPPRAPPPPKARAHAPPGCAAAAPAQGAPTSPTHPESGRAPSARETARPRAAPVPETPSAAPGLHRSPYRVPARAGPGQGHARVRSPGCRPPRGLGAVRAPPQDEEGRAYRARGEPCRQPPPPRRPAAASAPPPQLRRGPAAPRPSLGPRSLRRAARRGRAGRRSPSRGHGPMVPEDVTHSRSQWEAAG